MEPTPASHDQRNPTERQPRVAAVTADEAARRAARDAWVDRQMALRRNPPSVRQTILNGIAAGISAAVSTVVVSIIEWAIRLLRATGHL